MRGVVLSILTVGAGYLVYAVGDTGGASQFSSDDPAFAPPVVRMTSTTPPRVIHDTSEPVLTEAPRDRASLARDLQRALAHAGCYEGPISGKWTSATKEAMGAFLLVANAQLPIDTPDQTLLALATANANATCASKPPLQAADARAPSPSPAPTTASFAAPAQAAASVNTSGGDQALAERQWAPPEMLVPPKEAAPPPPTVTLTADEREASPVTETHVTETPVAQTRAPETRVSAATPAGVMSDAPVSTIPVAPPAPSVIHFEKGEAVAETDPTFAKKDPPAPPKVAQRPSKSRKRPSSEYDQISSSISKSWKSMQRSLSAMFD